MGHVGGAGSRHGYCYIAWNKEAWGQPSNLLMFFVQCFQPLCLALGHPKINSIFKLYSNLFDPLDLNSHLSLGGNYNRVLICEVKIKTLGTPTIVQLVDTSRLAQQFAP